MTYHLITIYDVSFLLDYPFPKTMSSTTSKRNKPIEGIQIRNQCCNICKKPATLLISRSVNNPGRGYFKCLECSNFVKWLSDEHVKLNKNISNEGFPEDAIETIKVLRSIKTQLKWIFFVLIMLVMVVMFKI